STTFRLDPGDDLDPISGAGIDRTEKAGTDGASSRRALTLPGGHRDPELRQGIRHGVRRDAPQTATLPTASRTTGPRRLFRMETTRITVPDLGRMKAAGERITMVTAYDWTFARLLDAAGVELLLVGDSLGNVVQGHDTTLPVTLDEMVYHTRLVARGARRALVCGDLPSGSYQSSPERAAESAIRLVKEGGAQAVKLEGGLTMAAAIEAIARMDVPVMGHVGLTPQSIHRMGGHKVQGRRQGHA